MKEKSKNVVETNRTFQFGDKVLIKRENITKEEDRYMGSTIKNRRHERSYEL